MRTLIAAAIVLLAGIPSASAHTGQGILILAPSGTAEWNAAVKELAAKADAQKPTELATGTPTRQSIDAAVRRLAQRGATEVTAVPFFLPTPVTADLTTGYAVPLRIASSPATDPLFGEVILSRAHEISRTPSDEVILLMGYGADGDGAPWSVNLTPAVQQLNRMRRFEAILLVNRPDTQTEREHQQVRNSLARLAGPQSRVLVVPLLPMTGGNAPTIEPDLQGHSYDVAKAGVITDARLVEWVLSAANVSR